MKDLSTSYLGLRLKTPLVCSSSPLCEDVAHLKQMEDAGAGAVVLPSLFEEQIALESVDLDRFHWFGSDKQAESLSYFPDMTRYNRGPEAYLEHLRRAKAALTIPVIASLNGCSRSGWAHFARHLAEAGADALELNPYELPTDPGRSGAEVEQGYVDLVRDVKAAVRIPVALKLGPYFSAPAHFAQRLDEAGANALVLFNRFYQPDFNLQTLEIEPQMKLSSPDELLLRLHWTALLFGHVKADLAITGGIHSGLDVVKAMMAGARVAMLASAVLKFGVDYLGSVLAELMEWMTEHKYPSVRQMQGSMSLRFVSNPTAYERANYMQVLRSYIPRES
jgi:dihydroorotate dehydrogenase (fumarate)